MLSRRCSLKRKKKECDCHGQDPQNEKKSRNEFKPEGKAKQAIHNCVIEARYCYVNSVDEIDSRILHTSDL